MELPPSDHRKIHLTAVDCCALWHAIIHMPKLFARWSEFEGRLQLLRGILLSSTELSFMPSDEVIAMYRSLAEAELRRLSGALHDGLQCRHSRTEHRDALHGILVRLPGPTTH